MSDRTTPATPWEGLAALAATLDPATPIPVPAGWVRELIDAAQLSLATPDLTVEAAAVLLGRRPSTVRGWCAAGTLAGAYRRGRSWYIPRTALHTEPTAPPGTPAAPAGGPVVLSDWRRVRAAARSATEGR